MEYKFKKGDRVVAILSDAFKVVEAGEKCTIEYIETRLAGVKKDDGTQFIITFRGLDKAFKLIEQ